MDIIVSEKQYKSLLKEEFDNNKDKIIFFKRRIQDFKEHIHEIIEEGLWHFNACDYKNLESFIREMSENSALTFIYSYDELDQPRSEEFEKIITDYIYNRYKKYLTKEWDEKECDE